MMTATPPDTTVQPLGQHIANKPLKSALQLLQPFYAPWTVSGTTRVSRYQKGKTNLDLLEQETVSGSGISSAYADLHLAPVSKTIISKKKNITGV